MKRVKVLLALAIVLVACPQSPPTPPAGDGDKNPPPASTITVNGSVELNGAAAAGVKVHLKSGVLITNTVTNAKGEFVVQAVTTPYSLTVVNTSVKAITVFDGLTRANPVVQQFGTMMPAAKQPGNLALTPQAGTNAAQVVKPLLVSTTAALTLNATNAKNNGDTVNFWVSSPTRTNGDSAVVAGGLATRNLNFGLDMGATQTTIVVTAYEMTTFDGHPRVVGFWRTAEIPITAGGSYPVNLPLATVTAWQNVTINTPLPTGTQRSITSLYTYPNTYFSCPSNPCVLDLPVGTNYYANVKTWAGGTSNAMSSADLPVGSSNPAIINFTAPELLKITSPANNATGVGAGLTVTWTGPDAVSAITMDFLPDWRLDAYTKGKTFTAPDLSGDGLTWPTNPDCYVTVNVQPGASVDDVASASMVFSGDTLYPRDYVHITTAP